MLRASRLHRASWRACRRSSDVCTRTYEPALSTQTSFTLEWLIPCPSPTPSHFLILWLKRLQDIRTCATLEVQTIQNDRVCCLGRKDSDAEPFACGRVSQDSIRGSELHCYWFSTDRMTKDQEMQRRNLKLKPRDPISFDGLQLVFAVFTSGPSKAKCCLGIVQVSQVGFLPPSCTSGSTSPS